MIKISRLVKKIDILFTNQ